MPPHLVVPVALVMAALIATIVRRVGVPSVVGYLLAGILLGPALLAVIPSGTEDPAGRAVIEQFGHIGLCVLLFGIGMQTRVEDFRPVRRPATALTIASVMLPFLFGWAIAMGFGWPVIAATMVGITFTTTSLSITASTLSELGLGDSREGALIFGVAVLDGLLGMLLLAALVAVMTPGANLTYELVRSLAQAVVFIAVGLWLGPHLVEGAISLCRWMNSPTFLLILTFSYLLVLSYAARVAGLAMIVGAYAAGLAFARHCEREKLAGQLQPLTDLLTPLFFVLVGASIEFSVFHPRTSGGLQTVGEFAALFAAAVLGKWLAPLCLRRQGVNHWLIGSAMIARGGIGFVFAQVGLAYGIFTPTQFSVVALVLACTAMLGPVLLRLASRRPRRGAEVPRQSDGRPDRNRRGGTG